jgi:hypothetical protein
LFQQIEFDNAPAKIKGYAPAAEALGYDYLLLYDHSSFLKPPRGPNPARNQRSAIPGSALPKKLNMWPPVVDVP